MGALQQYLDLYADQRALIEAHAPAPMNRLRAQALQALSQPGVHLPRLGQEGYEQFSVDDAFAPDYGLNLQRRLFNVDPRAAMGCEIPHVSTLLCATVNDIFAPSKRLLTGLPAGVTVCPLSQAPAKILDEYYGTVADLDNAATALNTLLAQDGILVHIAANTRLERPIQIVNLLDAPIPLMVARRLLVVVEENAYAQVLVCDHSRQHPDVRYLNSQVTEVVLRHGAELGLYELEESTLSTARVATLWCAQSQDARLHLNTTTLMAGRTRNFYRIDLHGPGCHADLGGMVIGTDDMVVDNSTLVRHHAEHGTSDQKFKYIVNDKARCAFEGTIVVDETARYTNAYQTNRNILAGPEARMHAKPQLEIYCDEVKCSHGATTGQLDERALFYMRQRGIPLDQARTMLMQAFMADVIEAVGIDGLRDRLRHLVERRLSGEDSLLCSDCAVAPQ